MPNKVYFRNYTTTSQISVKEVVNFSGFLSRLRCNTEDMVIIFNIKGAKIIVITLEILVSFHKIHFRWTETFIACSGYKWRQKRNANQAFKIANALELSSDHMNLIFTFHYGGR